MTNPAGADTDQPGPDPPPSSSANTTTKTGPTQTDIHSFFPPKFNSQLLNYFPARRQPTSDSSCNGNCEHDDDVSNDCHVIVTTTTQSRQHVHQHVTPLLRCCPHSIALACFHPQLVSTSLSPPHPIALACPLVIHFLITRDLYTTETTLS